MAACRLRQLQLLLWKNWLFSIRNWRSTLLQLLSPCFFLVVFTLLTLLRPYVMPSASELLASESKEPEMKPLGRYPKCKEWGDHNCTTLVAMGLNVSKPFSKLNSPFDLFNLSLSPKTQGCAARVLNEMRKVTGFDESDVVNNLDLFQTVQTIQRLNNASNQTENAVIFFDCVIDTTSSANSKLNYTIMYNYTRGNLYQLVFGSASKPDGRAELQIAIDTAFIRLVFGNNMSNLNISVSASNFPNPLQEYDQFKLYGPNLFLLFAAITFQFLILSNVVLEKDLLLRQKLKLTGMKDSMYWISWAITGLLIAILSTILFIGTGYACQLQFFLNTNILLCFVIFFVYSASTIPLVFFISIFINSRVKKRNLIMLVFIIYFLVIVGNNILYGIAMFKNVVYIDYVVYMFIVNVLKFAVLPFLPPFHLLKAMLDINMYVSSTDACGKPKNATTFSFHEFVTPIEVPGLRCEPNLNVLASGYLNNLILSKDEFPPPYQAVLLMIADAVFYSVVFWYINAIYPSNHGIPQKWYFPFLPNYWCGNVCTRNKIAHVRNRLRSSSNLVPLLNDEFVGETGRDSEENANLQLNNNALEIRKLSKVFRSGIRKGCDTISPPAVNGLSLTVQKNSILSLLGRNGAGKSTTIKMLTGLLKPTSGDILFYGTSFCQQIDFIRSILGVCSQCDVFWTDLTAREHMELFSGIKGVIRSKQMKEITDLLERVELNHVADCRVSTFNSGMRRSLSIALAFLGDPLIVFLDEPTMKMDQKFRRIIRNLILEMKQGRLIIVATDSMEEAKTLGDTIAIMARGQLRAMGTPVSLKKKFAGYSIDLVVQRNNVQQMMDFVSSQLNGATLKTDQPIKVEQGMLLEYNLPRECHRHLVPFFRMLEKDPCIASIVLDYSISQTTLEEIYNKVTVFKMYGGDAFRQSPVESGSFSSSSYGAAD